MNDILLFTGNSGAGKSTIVSHISELFESVHLSEREISRGIATEKGYSRSRRWVESVGLEQAATEIRERTLALIGEHDDQLVLVDGVYDRLLSDEIRERHTPRKLGIIAIEAPLTLRVARCAQRMGRATLLAASKDVAYLDTIKERVGVAEVLAAADLRVSNEGDIEKVVERVVQFYLDMTDQSRAS